MERRTGKNPNYLCCLWIVTSLFSTVLATPLSNRQKLINVCQGLHLSFERYLKNTLEIMSEICMFYP